MPAVPTSPYQPEAGPSTSSEEAAPPADFPPLSRADVLACVFSAWYPTFRKHSPKATIVKPLKPEFFDYLQADGVFLPEGSGPMGISELSDSDDDDSDDEDEPKFAFPELDAEIRRILGKYDGAVFPKLNWSSPQDASWMVAGPPLKCQCPADVYLLLKSSDFISHDLDHPFDLCADAPSPLTPTTPPAPEAAAASPGDAAPGTDASMYRNPAEETSSDEDDGPSESGVGRRERREVGYEMELVLKKWFEMPRSQEWRCFVRDNELVAISQRDPNYYDFLQSAEFLNALRDQVVDFYNDVVRDVFPSTSYTFDIYLTRTNDRVFLVDFNPYSPATDSLLLPWDTIHALSQSGRELPVVAVVEDAVTQPLPSFSHNRYPKDVVELSDGASVAEFAKEWQERLKEAVLDDKEGGGEEAEEGRS